MSPRYSLQRFADGDHAAMTIAGERQREPIGFSLTKAGKIVRVYRDPAISYL
jgi:hypothetical protein